MCAKQKPQQKQLGCTRLAGECSSPRPGALPPRAATSQRLGPAASRSPWACLQDRQGLLLRRLLVELVVGAHDRQRRVHDEVLDRQVDDAPAVTSSNRGRGDRASREGLKVQSGCSVKACDSSKHPERDHARQTKARTREEEPGKARQAGKQLHEVQN